MPDTGEVAAWISNGTQLTVPVQDRIGSTVGLVGSSGALATQYQYEPYGKASSSGQASVYPYQFAGTEQDTGLYHLQYRFYSPGLARFISQDPLGVSGSGVNLFAYANDDPVNEVDPLGMDSFCPNGDCTGGGSTNQNPSGGSGFSLFNLFIGLLQDLFGGGGSHPTPSRKLTLGGEHNPAAKLLGAQKSIAPNQLNMEPLPGASNREGPPGQQYTRELIIPPLNTAPNPPVSVPKPTRPSALCNAWALSLMAAAEIGGHSVITARTGTAVGSAVGAPEIGMASGVLIGGAMGAYHSVQGYYLLCGGGGGQ
jgi:RHS repeat-associated protein